MIQPNELMSLRTLRLIASSRAILAASLCFSAAASHANATGAANIAYLLLGYLAFTLATWVALRRKEAAYWLLNRSLALQATDTVVLGLLVYMTGGADSPFFPALSLLVVIATIQWGSRGSIAMGLVILSIYLPTGVLTVFGSDVDRQALPHFINRLIAISVNTMLLAVFGNHFERIVRQMARLSQAFPDSVGGPTPPIAECLEHAIALIAADRGLLLWQESDEPHATLVLRADGRTRRTRLLLTEEPVAPDWRDDVFMLNRERSAFVQRGGRIALAGPCPLSPELDRHIPFDRTLAIRARAATGECWIFVPDDGAQANEGLAVGRFIATQVALALTKWHTDRERLDLRGREERLRLARGLHDGVLQFLAGTSLQLGALARKLDGDIEAQARIEELQVALREEQRELRALVGAVDHPAPRAGTFADELRHLAGRLGKHWDIVATAEIVPEDLAVPDALRLDLLHITREGVANAVRHGDAARVDIRLVAKDGILTLTVADDGRGFETDGTPKSISARTRTLDGTVRIESSEGGATVTVAIPRRDTLLEILS